MRLPRRATPQNRAKPNTCPEDVDRGASVQLKKTAVGYPTRAIVVEATWADLERGEWRSQVTTAAAIGSALGWIAAGVPIVMAGDHARAGRYVSRLLLTAARRRWREARALITPRGPTEEDHDH